MRNGASALYFGEVVHARTRPVTHALKYKVFSLLFDLDDIDGLAQNLRLFSRNRFNLFSLYDADFGDGGADLKTYLHGLATEAGMAETISRFSMLAYPRILGYAFNPLTVYFGFDAQDHVCLTIYEVHNTFGERKTYVLPAHPDANGLIYQHCPKQLFVSPFNKVEGTYSFHITPLADTATIGVSLKDADGPKLRAHFRGHREALTDRNLLWAITRTGWMTPKVTAGIHIEALKLWLKGLRLQKRPVPPKPVSVFSDTNEDEKRAA